jgi:hypothetical protein
MANVAKWNAPAAVATVLSTDLNSLGNSSLSTPTESGATYDNSANLDLYANFELALASLNPTGSPYCALHFLPTFDGTNYADAAASLTSHVLCSFPLTTGSAAKRVTVKNVLLPALKGKFALENGSGVSLAASGNTVKIIVADVNLNG